MTIDERLEAITRNLELLASFRKDDERRFAILEDAITRVATATEMLMYSMENHEQRIAALEGR